MFLNEFQSYDANAFSRLILTAKILRLKDIGILLTEQAPSLGEQKRGPVKPLNKIVCLKLAANTLFLNPGALTTTIT